MKKKTLALFLSCALAVSMLSGCGSKDKDTKEATESSQASETDDQAAADEVAKLIDDIYVQERTDKTDEQCAAAKAAWDKLTDAQKQLVEGENADPDYFGRDTGDASKDDPLNADDIGENEILYILYHTEDAILASVLMIIVLVLWILAIILAILNKIMVNVHNQD